MSEGINILAECRECGTKFGIGKDSDVVSFRQEYKGKDGRSILLTYYDCPKCGKRHFVQADDAYSLDLLASVSKLFVQIAAAKVKGTRPIPARQQEKYKKHKSHLDRYRIGLMRRWTGQYVTEAKTGEACVLEFSV